MTSIAKSTHHQQPLRTTILLVNLGTPKAASYIETMRFLRTFLSDPRVINLPKLLWYPILYGIILPFRSLSSMKKYQKIVVNNKLPLQKISQDLCALVNEKVEKTYTNTHVELAMRYGDQNIASVLEKLRKIPHQQLIIIPLFPQFSATTSASIFDEAARCLKQWNFLPNITFVRDYCNEKSYIRALANSIKNHWEQDKPGQILLFTYHGLPEVNHVKGDPYACYCFKTTRLVSEALGLDPDQYKTVFQSRFGPSRWLQPYTEDTIISLAKDGVETIDVIAPSFAVDCLETIDEIGREYEEVFLQHGGKVLRYIPALNASEASAEILSEVIHKAVK